MAVTSTNQTGVLSQGAAAAAQPTNKMPTQSQAPALGTLYPTTPTAGTFAASTGTAAATGAAPTANASLATPAASINNGNINPNDSTNAASQLDAITRENSPYIQQATQQGLLSAASRGLENSSLGAGAAEAAAVQAALPLAEQNAQTAEASNLQNSQLATQASEFNAGQQNANQQLNAQLATQTNQFNASQKQTADATNAAAMNAMKQQTEQIIGQLNTQYLSGNQAQVLAGIQGQYSELIAQNQSAATLTNTVMSGLASSFANQNIDQGRINTETTGMLNILHSALSVIDGINGGVSATPTGPPANSPIRNPNVRPI